MSILMLASGKGNIDTVKLLLKFNAQLNLQWNDGLSSIQLASYNGHVDVIKVLLENDAQVDLQDSSGQSPL